MTKDEALKILKECRENGFKYTFYTLGDYHTALDMAIKALGRESCEDAISRQAAIDALNRCTDVYHTNLPTLVDKEEVRRALTSLSPAQPEIIRCRDCKYYREYGYVNGRPKFLPKCTFSSIYVNAVDFCSKAERR